MTVSLLSSVKEFLAKTEEFRRNNPEKTNVISSVAQQVASGERTYDKYFWWIVANGDDDVIGIAMRTAPHGMLISPMPVEASVQLAREAAKYDDEMPGVGGPTPEIHAFLGEYENCGSGGSSRSTDISGRDLLYVLTDLIPAVAEGQMVVATRDQFAKILTWIRDFADEAGVLMHQPSEAIEDGFNRDSWRFWVAEGEIVSMAGYAPLVKVPGGIVGRIGPVYTPPNKRRNGFAGALTAALSQQLLDLGAKVILYTDANNPTSNSVYQKIGFTKIGENEKYSFVAPA
jgi:GNAT superfamily N-acetyltransferase